MGAAASVKELYSKAHSWFYEYIDQATYIHDFNSMDKDEDGGVSLVELKQWITKQLKVNESWKIFITEPQILSLAHRNASRFQDSSQNPLSRKVVNYGQFKALLIHLFITSVLWTHFKHADNWEECGDVGNKQLNFEEFALACRTLCASHAGEDLTDAQLYRDFQALDANCSNSVGFDEVCNYCVQIVDLSQLTVHRKEEEDPIGGFGATHGPAMTILASSKEMEPPHLKSPKASAAPSTAAGIVSGIAATTFGSLHNLASFKVGRTGAGEGQSKSWRDEKPVLSQAKSERAISTLSDLIEKETAVARVVSMIEYTPDSDEGSFRASDEADTKNIMRLDSDISDVVEVTSNLNLLMVERVETAGVKPHLENRSVMAQQRGVTRTGSMMADQPSIAGSVFELVGRTPLLRLGKMAVGLRANILLKMESMGPGRSVGDRIARSLIEGAESRHNLVAGNTTLIEATVGNVGVALAMLCASRNYSFRAFVPEDCCQSSVTIMRFFGAKVVLTPSSEGIQGARARALSAAEKLKGEPGHAVVYLNQFESIESVDVHRDYTGPELWIQSDCKIDILVAGVGTGSTITGCAQYLRAVNPAIHVVAVEPEESPVLSGSTNCSKHSLEGIGFGFKPDNCHTQLLDEIVQVSKSSAVSAVRSAAREEGLLLSASAGAALSAAIKIARRVDSQGKTIVVIIPACGERYLSSDVFAEIYAEALQQKVEDVGDPWEYSARTKA